MSLQEVDEDILNINHQIRFLRDDNSGICGLFNWRSDFDVNTYYFKNDLVRDSANGDLFVYISPTGTTGPALNNTDKWNMMITPNKSHTHPSSEITDFDSSADARITLQKGQNNGLATLDSQGKLTSSQIVSRKCDIYYNPSTELVLSTGWQDIPLNIERIKDSDFSHSSDSAEVSINTTDNYFISARVTCYSTTGNTRSVAQMRLMLDSGSGYAEIGGTIGSMYCRRSVEGQATATVTLILNLSSGDKIKMQVIRLSGANVSVLSEGSSLTLFKI